MERKEYLTQPQHRLYVRIDRELKNDFMEFCDLHDFEASKVIRAGIKEFIRTKIDPNDNNDHLRKKGLKSRPTNTEMLDILGKLSDKYPGFIDRDRLELDKEEPIIKVPSVTEHFYRKRNIVIKVLKNNGMEATCTKPNSKEIQFTIKYNFVMPDELLEKAKRKVDQLNAVDILIAKKMKVLNMTDY